MDNGFCNSLESSPRWVLGVGTRESEEEDRVGKVTTVRTELDGRVSVEDPE